MVQQLWVTEDSRLLPPLNLAGPHFHLTTWSLCSEHNTVGLNWEPAPRYGTYQVHPNHAMVLIKFISTRIENSQFCSGRKKKKSLMPIFLTQKTHLFLSSSNYCYQSFVHCATNWASVLRHMGTRDSFLPLDSYKTASHVLCPVVGSSVQERKTGASPAQSQHNGWELGAHACQETLKEPSWFSLTKRRREGDFTAAFKHLVGR